MNHHFSSFKQRGVMLLEILLAISILGLIGIGVNELVNRSLEDTKASVAALHLKTVGDAANEYIKDNYAALTSTATAAQPALIRVSDLIAGGYLTAGSAVANPRHQSTCVLVLQPTLNNLTALAITEGGDTIDDLTLGQIAATVGGSGGGVYSTAATTVRGAMGGWSFPVGNFANANHLGQHCDGITTGTVALTAGHPAMALWFADGNAISATLYRNAVPGNPALNTLNTPVVLGAGTVQVPDSACTAPLLGALGRSSAGQLLMCDGTAWKLEASGGSDNAIVSDTYASLPSCNAEIAWRIAIIKSPSDVDRSPTRRARSYLCNMNSAWQVINSEWTYAPLPRWDAIAVDVNGNMKTPIANSYVIGMQKQPATVTAKKVFASLWAKAGHVNAVNMYNNFVATDHIDVNKLTAEYIAAHHIVDAPEIVTSKISAGSNGSISIGGGGAYFGGYTPVPRLQSSRPRGGNEWSFATEVGFVGQACNYDARVYIVDYNSYNHLTCAGPDGHKVMRQCWDPAGFGGVWNGQCVNYYVEGVVNAVPVIGACAALSITGGIVGNSGLGWACPIYHYDYATEVGVAGQTCSSAASVVAVDYDRSRLVQCAGSSTGTNTWQVCAMDGPDGVAGTCNPQSVKMIGDLTTLRDNTKKEYLTVGSYGVNGSDLTPKLVASNATAIRTWPYTPIIPVTLAVTGTATTPILWHQLGGHIKIKSFKTTSFSIEMTRMTPDVCIPLMTGASGWTSVQVAGAVARSTFPISLATAQSDCNLGTTMTFIN